MHKPRLAITMGDPAGVGPETIVGVWRQASVHDGARPFVVGHPAIIERAVRLLGVAAKVVPIDSPAAADPAPDCIPCLCAVDDAAADVPPAKLDARGGHAAYEALLAATRMALAGEIDGLVTAPLNKAALHLAGHLYPGHTELLAELCGVDDFAMMLYLGPGEPLRAPAGLGVVHTTLHMALADVFAHLTSEEIAAKARLADTFVRRIGVATPRIGIAALNPHAGEEGLFGNEERTIIEPAVQLARERGIDATGPLPCDTLMVRARDGDFDAIVAMYHDQGHITLKLLGMHRAVNVTLGLPIVRTSVAHGTAFDKAWQGRAETSGMLEAIRVAALLARHRTSVDTAR
ncbi:MAG: 4-hydroxythreonine-4-phosphate dehydrogenase PdxA [Pirellulales bacterium]|nr:4-hydroxythreonine-4-phosphate dehydrogenase PdxA [Pirellulales bacterium]